MNRHQVLTGACNIGDKCHAIGSVEGIHFLVYAAGCDIVILASDFQRVQIIPGVTHGNIKVSCIDCSTDTGKIVASYQKKIYVFEPAPLLHHESTHKLDYHWCQTAMFEAECIVNCLAWNQEGTKLLTGGEVIQIWGITQETPDSETGGKSVKFSLGHHEDGFGEQSFVKPEHDVEVLWETVWRCRPATPVYHLQYSCDGLLFASAGKDDRLVKIWYEDRKIQLPLSHADSIVSPKKQNLHYSFVYISHPRAVTGFSWRKTSKFMPRGSVANMLITSCRDNVCRIWSETILPDDGLLDLEQFDPSMSFDPKFHTHRHKKRFMQRLKTIRIHMHQYDKHAIHKRKRQSKFGQDMVMSIPNIASMSSVHDFHKFAIHQNGVAPALHFHLAASVNPETDIPLLPVVGGKMKTDNGFQLHWVNNKELQFTMESEKILQEMHKSSLYDEHARHQSYESQTDSDSDPPDTDEQPDYVHINNKKKYKSSKHSKHKSDELGHHSNSEPSLSSAESFHHDSSVGSGGSPEIPGSVMDALDRKIENLLQDWHQNPDMLFTIHPVDGSYLVWLVDWLDEYTPYCFRQAQISFSSRIPHAFPVPDARSMTTSLLMFCNYSKMDIKSAMKMCESDFSAEVKRNQSSAATGKSSPGQNDNMLIPNVLMISKHLNGSLNQWQISFQENSKFSTVVSIAHVSRVCGHRFRTNSAVCHPALPLLITTSQHNIPEKDEDQSDSEEDSQAGFQYCSELILWRVDPVGPLSKSGGLVELAKINAPHVSAFSEVAWVPTLLPSTILCGCSNSPSTLFVASDGESLRLYQAVIDARSLLMEMTTRKEQMSFSSNTSSGYSLELPDPPGDLFNIISVQSSSRPGCIIELDAFTDAQQYGQQTQLLHVFQEQLLTGKVSKGDNSSGMEPIVDLRNLGSFEELFYLVVLEKNKDCGSTLHMWKMTIASQAGTVGEGVSDHGFCMDYTMTEDDNSNPPSGRSTPELAVHRSSGAKLVFSTTKVLSQKLSLPEGVDVICANVAAGHLSSSSVFPACLAPYLIATACSDGEIRFWQCTLAIIGSQLFQVNRQGEPLHVSLSTKSFEFGIEEEDGVKKPRKKTSVVDILQDTSYNWEEWKPVYQEDKSTKINIPGKPVTVSCAYTGRIAVAYKVGESFRRKKQSDANSRFCNLYVAIYECESSGGSEWVKEDTIELKNIRIPETKADVDLECNTEAEHLSDSESHQHLSPSSNLLSVGRTKSVPTFSAIMSAKKELDDHDDKINIMKPSHLVQLDWVSTEDGSHILTVGVGSKIMMYAQVSDEVVQASKKVESEEKSNKKVMMFNDPGHKIPLNEPGSRRAMLQKSKSMVVDEYQEQLQWMKLRSVELSTADGLPALPMHMSWVRGGIIVIGMDNEMHVYSQWRNVNSAESVPLTEDTDIRAIEDVNVMSIDLNKESMLQSRKSIAGFKPSYSMPNFKKILSNVLKKDPSKSSTSLKTLDRSDSSVSLTVIHELGLFEAARQANPVLPQYHPKSLMELLNFGKVRRVKAILAHLTRCIAGREVTKNVDEMASDDKNHVMRQRTYSIAQSPGESTMLNEEITLDYVEIRSIPPLPLYALLGADNDIAPAPADIIAHPGPVSPSEKTDYKDLFQSSVMDGEELDINVLSTSADGMPRKRGLSSSTGPPYNPNHFAPAHAQLLCKHLTHMHLPGLSGQDQMYLLALADTVAQTKTDFADSFEPTGPHSSVTASSHTAESLDDCGLRFLLAVRHHMYLMGSLPPKQRVALQKQGLKTFNLVWAFHSEATEELLSLLPNMQKGEATWQELKMFGGGWWINNINILKRTIEKVAKAAFQAKKDPMDACLFYLAMKKKTVLWGLFRSVENKRMSDFFRNDFSQERWRKAALKNAYDLLGRQRFEHAAAFFLLADHLKDAIEVCIDKLHDIQLALVISRLFDGEEMMTSEVRKILYTHIFGCDENGKNYSELKVNADPFLRSMGYWLIKDYRGALQTLLQTDLGKMNRAIQDTDNYGISNVFNFYNYLRTHPLLVRHRIVSAVPSLKNKSVIPGFTKQQTIVGSPEDDVATFVDRVTPMERRLFFSTAHAHCKNGSPILALEVLSKLPVVIDDDVEIDTKLSEVESDTCINTGNISDFSESSRSNGHQGDQNSSETDWSKPVSSSNNQTADSIDWGQPVVSSNKQTADSFDWGQPVVTCNNQMADSMDWGQPVVTSNNQTADSMDWGQPSAKFGLDEEFKIEFNDSDHESEEELPVPFRNGEIQEEIPSIVVADIDNETETTATSTLKYKGEKKIRVHQVDIFAQQYKFIACLKVMMEEMQTLATGFEVDGGQLRYQVYIWLEREVEALRLLCNYGDEEEIEEDKTVISDGPFDDGPEGLHVDNPRQFQRSMSTRSDASIGRPTLHEVILAEKMDFEAKLDRMARRKQWLQHNQQLLRTLVAYCVLQGSEGGGLSSVQMELLLLLQELQQEKPQQQLLSPLPFPTTLPLLSASIASSKTVTADPIMHLQCLCQDLLHSVIEFSSPPGLNSPLHTVLVMRNLSIALSSCIYQCLCDSDSFVVSLNENTDVGLEGFLSHNFVCDASHLMAGVKRLQRKSFSANDDIINTSPAKWPGVTTLRVLLAREKDEDAPKLNILLTESLVSVYVSLLINALATFDCHMLFRLTAHKFDQQLWSSLFGGGVKTVLKMEQAAPQRSSDETHKQRLKLHRKIMGPQGQGQMPKESRKTYKEKFIPPELSMITFFMTKPFIVNSDSSFSYDSEDSLSSDEEESEDDYDDEASFSRNRPTSLPMLAVRQHTDPNSYSWCLIRYSIVKLVRHSLLSFLPHIGLEIQELPVCSPLLHAVLRVIEQWEEVLLGKLELFAAPPENYIPGVEVDLTPGIPTSKYRALMKQNNSPFINGHTALPMKRLWFHLLRQDVLRDTFVRYVFKKPSLDRQETEKHKPEAHGTVLFMMHVKQWSNFEVDFTELKTVKYGYLDCTRDILQIHDSSLDGIDGPRKVSEPMKIIHKEQDIITAFALNHANASCLTLATQKEIIELDISHVLSPPDWIDNETELDIEMVNNPAPPNPMENVDFFVVQTPSDIPNIHGSGTGTPVTGQSSAASTPTANLAPGQIAMTGRQTTVITRRVIPGVRRIGSHPSLPHYLTGSADGSVRLWEWEHSQPLTVLRAPGNFPKVTKVLFNAQGNKCCVSDTEGHICLWQVGHGSNFNKPIMSLSCHNKTTSDFVFVGSSSLIATAGHSSESKNICLWDTLLPPRSSCVHAFTCHEHGSPALVYAPHHQLLISGGRKGEICIFDIRQRQMRHTFQASESPIRCLAIDPEEEYFVTGSADGDIKVWGLDVHQLVVGFQGEHSRSSTFFRNMGQATGVTQVGIGPRHHLFSCGVDGSMKFRALPERDSIVRYWAS